jgi:Tfp pilus assembly protein PilO
MTARRLRFDIRQAGKPILLVMAALLVANVGAFALLVRPAVNKVRALEAGNEPELQALRQRREAVETLEQYFNGLERAEADLAALRADVLSTRDARMVDVQQEVERLCGEFRIDLDSATYDNDLLPEEELDRFAMEVPLEGGYANLRQFLQAVENSTNFLVVERVALGEGKEGGVMLQLNITLAVYFDMPAEMKGDRPPRRRSGRRA